MTHKLTVSRRDGLKGLLAISAMGALAACQQRQNSGETGKAAQAQLKYAAKGAFFGAHELAVLSAIAQTIIPQTETGGAIEAGVPDDIQDLVSVWGDDNYRLYWREGLASVAADLRGIGGQDFETLSTAQRLNTLKKYDAQIYANLADHQFYHDMKSTVGTAYYMSELGATEELHYEPVPGDFRGDVLFSEIGKAWAT